MPLTDTSVDGSLPVKWAPFPAHFSAGDGRRVCGESVDQVVHEVYEIRSGQGGHLLLAVPKLEISHFLGCKYPLLFIDSHSKNRNFRRQSDEDKAPESRAARMHRLIS